MAVKSNSSMSCFWRSRFTGKLQPGVAPVKVLLDTAVVERGLIGGSCPNIACLPADEERDPQRESCRLCET
jgi:hypothetical protein